MSTQHTIDAEYKGEERYSKLALAYTTEDEAKMINQSIKDFCEAKCDLIPEIYTSSLSNGRKVIVIEYHDDYDRTAGRIFQQILKKLDVKIID